MFNGFSHETIDFLKDLKSNNTKSWFSAHRHIYDRYVFPESQSFVVAMGEKLSQIAPKIVAIPKTDKAIFRIYRDTRFSRDKKPYKTHLAIFLWEGERKKLENSGFYFHIDAEKLLLGVGIHTFSPEVLSIYRGRVVHRRHGPSLDRAIKTVQTNPSYVLGWKKYKKVPHGYDVDHPYADYLLYGGIGFLFEEKLPQTVFSTGLIDYCYDKFRDMAPIHDWLRDMVEGK